MENEDLIIQKKFSSALENLQNKNLDHAQKLFEEKDNFLNITNPISSELSCMRSN